MRFASAAWAFALLACGAPAVASGPEPGSSEPESSEPEPLERSHEHAEAVDLLAAWVALAGLGDASSRGQLRGQGFFYAEVHGGAQTSSEDRARALRVCGDPELRVVEGGYDVTFDAQTVAGPETLAWGRRQLELRGPPGALRVASDRFEVLGTRALDPTRPRPFAGAECGGPAPRGCVVLSAEGEPLRRLAYPEPAGTRGPGS